jgi:hypothetical protein
MGSHNGTVEGCVKVARVRSWPIESTRGCRADRYIDSDCWSQPPGRQVVTMEEEFKKLPDDTVVLLRKLAHDLSNAIENVMQASYLLSQAKLDEQNGKWLTLINSAAAEAATINREIREILRSQA